MDLRYRDQHFGRDLTMEADEWTPRQGWIIALKRGGLRIAILFALQIIATYILWDTFRKLPQHPVFVSVSFAFAGALSFPGGYLVARRLGELTGLAGRTLLLPVLVPLGVCPFLAYQLVSLLYGGGGGLIIYGFGAGLGIWGVMMGFRTLMLQ